MIALYHAPRTRSVRILWLLEELGLPYELRKVPFVPPARTFSQPTPSGKLPVIEDDGTVISESGAILEYILEKYDNGRLAPPVGSPERGAFLQWVHFAEGTAFPPFGIFAWHVLYRKDAASVPTVLADARDRGRAVLEVLEKALQDRDYLLGAGFSGADIMMGFTLVAAREFGVLDEGFPGVMSYLGRLLQRPALQRALAS